MDNIIIINEPTPLYHYVVIDRYFGGSPIVLWTRRMIFQELDGAEEVADKRRSRCYNRFTSFCKYSKSLMAIRSEIGRYYSAWSGLTVS